MVEWRTENGRGILFSPFISIFYCQEFIYLGKKVSEELCGLHLKFLENQKTGRRISPV